jgi:undecaprenyl-diphosphatase
MTLTAIAAQLVRLDHALRAWAVTHRIAWLDRPIFLLSVTGVFGGIWMFIALILAILGRLLWRDFGRLVLALVVTTVLTDYVLKPAIHRARPFRWTPDVVVIGFHSSSASFPSGHTAAAVAGAFVFTGLMPEGRVAWWLLAAVIAYSRIYLGVHYPLDVAAGAVVGIACAAVIWRLTKGRQHRIALGYDR